MQTIIMTVGTSLLTNPDRDLLEEQKRPWVGQRTVGDRAKALNWLAEQYIQNEAFLEKLSAETNTFERLDPKEDDEIILLHSDTDMGLECAEILQDFFTTILNQKNVLIHQIPGINYELDQQGSALERMADLLKELIQNAKGGLITLAATGGFKAQTMIMGIIGNSQNIPVCYVHEQYKALIYLPFSLTPTTSTHTPSSTVNLPESSKPRSEVVKVQESKIHHRPKVWGKVKKMLENLPWIEYVRYDKNARSAPKNSIKQANRGTSDGRYVFWMNLYESEDTKMFISIETTGYTREHAEQAATELRQKLGRLIS